MEWAVIVSVNQFEKSDNDVNNSNVSEVTDYICLAASCVVVPIAFAI